MSGPDQPALPPPPGKESNFIDPPNGNARAHFVLAFSIVLVLSGVSVRAYSKIFCMKKISFQDGMLTSLVWKIRCWQQSNSSGIAIASKTIRLDSKQLRPLKTADNINNKGYICRLSLGSIYLSPKHWLLRPPVGCSSRGVAWSFSCKHLSSCF